MKTYIINLFNYDYFANNIILDSIIKAGEPEKALQLMAHILAANQIWFNRCLGLPHASVELWTVSGKPGADLAATLKQNHIAWSDYIKDINDFDKNISYQNTRGDNFTNKLADILIHLTNHGTHHRAQIGQQLKFAGADSLPITDYIAYIRQLND